MDDLVKGLIEIDNTRYLPYIRITYEFLQFLSYNFFIRVILKALVVTLRLIRAQKL